MKKKNNYKIFFDHHAPEYMDNVFTKNTQAEIDFIVKTLNLPEGASILDVGCGTGRHAVELAKQGSRVTGIDVSAGMLREAQKAADAAGVEVEFIHIDATKYEADSLYDAAICLCEGAFGLLGIDEDPLEHDLAILNRINRALKPDSMLILNAINALEKIRKYGKEEIAKGIFDPVMILEMFEMEYNTPRGKKSVTVHEKGYTASELKLLLNMAGFETLHIYGGTAGNWGPRPIDPDEIEIMAIARKIGKR